MSESSENDLIEMSGKFCFRLLTRWRTSGKLRIDTKYSNDT